MNCQVVCSIDTTARGKELDVDYSVTLIRERFLYHSDTTGNAIRGNTAPSVDK